MSYVKKDEKIKDGLNQIWFYPPLPYGSASERMIISQYDEGEITKLEAKLVEFLYHVQFATEKQIKKEFGDEDGALLIKNAKKLIKKRILNGFAISEDESVHFDKDALIVFTIDYGGAVLVKHLTGDQDAENWKCDDLRMDSTKVNKYLMALDFYQKLKEEIPDKIKYFTFNPLLTIGKSKYSPKALFSIKQDEENEAVFILDCTREEDYYNGYQTKFDAKMSKLESIVSTNAWKKYSDQDNPPIIVLYANNDEAMKRGANLLSITNVGEFRVCSEESMEKPLSKSFYKIKKDEKTGDEKLASVNLKIFTK